MNADACLRRVLDSLADGSPDEANKAGQELADWIDRGGFPPSFTKLSDYDRNTIALLLSIGITAGIAMARRMDELA